MYQCFVRNDQESAQATSELKLGGRFDPPEFVRTFGPKVVEPGPFVSLACVAKGDPAPTIEWFVYGKRVQTGVITDTHFQSHLVWKSLGKTKTSLKWTKKSCASINYWILVICLC